MRLKKLEIYGFKSFAERVEISFEDGITGIVGPNGSGKSNIADAVRWVLGEQSAKTLRGGKMEDVIFSGTEKRRKLSWCEVSLVFDNSDGALPVDFVEVCVTRRVFRNGDSEYLINGANCRLKDVVDLFRDTGIGKEGYCLIGQGQVDEILSVKSEDRRNVFEEAAGIMKFKSRKTDAERRMENTRLNLSRAEDIIAELEGRLEPLREQSAAAREYLQLRDEIKGLELNSFLTRTERYTARLTELEGAISALEGEIGDSEGRQRELSARRDEINAAVAQLEPESAALREDVQEYIRRVEAREGSINVLKERIAATERERARLEDELSAAREGEEGLARRVAELGERISSEKGDIDSQREILATLESELNNMAAALSERENLAEEIKGRIIDAMNRMSDVRSEQSRLEAMRDSITSRLGDIKLETEQGEGELGIWHTRASEAREELNRENQLKDELDASLALVIEKVDRSASLVEELSGEARSITARKQETSSRLRVLEEMQRDYEGYYNSVKQVLMHSRRQPNTGVHGVVATLITVPRELERAIDMVLGAALQNIVVEREEDAKRMIDYLREGRLGRATFLPISSVRGRTLSQQERSVLALPGCVGLASELISFDPKYAQIVDSLLGRTIIAENLDAGIKIQRAGRQAFRLVTLDGDVMHSGGSMTGGSVQSRVTSLLSREREVAEHREALNNHTLALEEISARLSEQEDVRASLKRERGEIYDNIRQQEIACARAEAHVKSATDGLAAQSDRNEKIDLERQRMERQLDEIVKSIEGLSNRRDDEDRTHSGDKAQVARLQGEISAARAAHDARAAEVNEIKVALASRERGLQALISEDRRLSGEKTDTESMVGSNLVSLDACLKKLEEDTARLSQEERLLIGDRAGLEGARERFTSSDGRRTQAQGELRDLSDSIDSLRDTLNDLTDRKHRSEIQYSRVESEYKQMQERIWEDYELTYAGAEEYRTEGFKLAESERRIADIRARIREMGAVNVGAVDEFRQVNERYAEMTVQRDDLMQAQIDIAGIIDELNRQMERQFVSQFNMLNENFRQVFAELFGGGQAELRLADPKDALNCGIDIVAQPPGKKLQMLSLLSGGERALTAIAIQFAMLKLKPTPFCFLDEIEAALDDANIDNFADYLKDYSRRTQFVVVTHRKGTMERCDALYGVAMEEKGVSKMVSIRLRDAAG